MLKDAIKTEILSTRALGYRATALASAAAMALLNWFPGINYSELTLFGIKPPSGADARALVFTLGWSLVAYHFAFFAYYAWRDARLWLHGSAQKDVQEHILAGICPWFPEWPMYFGLRPSRPASVTSGQNKIATWTPNKRFAPTEWIGIPVKINGGSATDGFGYRVSESNARGFRQRFRWFLLVDLGLPLALAATAIGLTHSQLHAIVAAPIAVLCGVVFVYLRR